MSKHTPPAIKDLIVELSKKRKICIRDNQMHQQALEHLQENFTKSIGKQEVLKTRGITLSR